VPTHARCALHLRATVIKHRLHGRGNVGSTVSGEVAAMGTEILRNDMR
jgi:hypothetical protein